MSERAINTKIFKLKLVCLDSASQCSLNTREGFARSSPQCVVVDEWSYFFFTLLYLFVHVTVTFKHLVVFFNLYDIIQGI